MFGVVAQVSSNPLLLNPVGVHLLSPQPAPNLAALRGRAGPPLDEAKEALFRDKYGLSAVVSLASSQAGFDLTSLGLNLNSPHPIWRSLVSPFTVDDAAQLKVARQEFTSPASFVALDFRPSPEQLRTAPLDALFFAFLAAPQDALQAAAAEELRLRGYTWNQQQRTWTCKDGLLPPFDLQEWTK
jgi:hypothetical protein